MGGAEFRPPGRALWPWVAREVRPGWHRVGPWMPWQDRWVRRTVALMVGTKLMWLLWVLAGARGELAAVAFTAWSWRAAR